MTTVSTRNTTTEAVAVFHDSESLEAAIDELQSSGFDRAELSLLASEQSVAEKLGHLYQKVGELEDDPSVPRAAYVSREAIGAAEGALIGAPLYVVGAAAIGAVVASGGTLAAAIAAGLAAGGTGALIGAALAQIVGHHHASYLGDQLQHGGLLLWVRTRDSDHESRAKEILSRHSASDVHLHELPPIAT